MDHLEFCGHVSHLRNLDIAQIGSFMARQPFSVRAHMIERLSSLIGQIANIDAAVSETPTTQAPVNRKRA